MPRQRYDQFTAFNNLPKLNRGSVENFALVAGSSRALGRMVCPRRVKSGRSRDPSKWCRLRGGMGTI